MPNLLSFPTSCVCLELRSLSSTGITRLPRSYEPRRHPKAPGLSLTGFRLVILSPRQGASRVACVFLVYMLSPLPRHSVWLHLSLTSPDVSAFPALADRSACATSFSRLAQRSLALRPAHSPSHLVTLYTRGFSHFVTSMTTPIASGWSDSRVGLSPTGKTPPLHGARQLLTYTDLQLRATMQAKTVIPLSG